MKHPKARRISLKCILFGHSYVFVNKRRDGWIISHECKRCGHPGLYTKSQYK